MMASARLAALEEADHRPEDLPVGFLVELLGDEKPRRRAAGGSARAGSRRAPPAPPRGSAAGPCRRARSWWPWPGGGARPGYSAVDRDRQRRRHVSVEPDRHLVLPERLDGLVQQHPPLLEGHLVPLEELDHVLRRHRAVEPSVLRRARGHGKRQRLDAGRGGLRRLQRPVLFLRALPLEVLDVLQVRRRRLHRQLAGQQEVPGVAVGDVPRLAPVPERGHVGHQDHLHRCVS